MKLKLLFTGLVFSAFTANAQVATLNENFNNFNTGNTTFPQNSWSAVLPPMNTPPSPPPLINMYHPIQEVIKILPSI